MTVAGDSGRPLRAIQIGCITRAMTPTSLLSHCSHAGIFFTAKGSSSARESAPPPAVARRATLDQPFAVKHAPPCERWIAPDRLDLNHHALADLPFCALGVMTSDRYELSKNRCTSRTSARQDALAGDNIPHRSPHRKCARLFPAGA